MEKAGTLWNNLGYHLKMVADYTGARESYERALGLWRGAYGQGDEDAQHPQVATALNNLGLVQQALGELAGARESFERALRIFENSQLPPDHPYIESLKGKLEALG